MAKKQNQTEPKEKSPQQVEQAPKANLVMRGKGLEINSLEQAYRFGQYLAASTIVPESFRGKPNDCLVVLDLASRLGASWLAVMQNVYVVYGRTGMMSTLVISLINGSGLFTDPLDYDVFGDDPDKDNYKVRAYATRKSTGKVLYGPWITWKLVRAEGWEKKKDSKWLSMPDQMFHYRAASWFANRHCPEVKMGMMTVEEAEELPAKHVESKEVTPGVEGLKARLAERNGETPEAQEPTGTPIETEVQAPNESDEGQSEAPEPVEQDAEMAAKIAQQKEALGVGAGNSKKSNLF